MPTVQQTVELLVLGAIPLRQAVEDFEARPWPADRAPAPAQGAGVWDVPLPSPNSFDWVDLNPSLTDYQRQALRQAHDRALQ